MPARGAGPRTSDPRTAEPRPERRPEPRVGAPCRRARRASGEERARLPSATCCKEGQEIIVQIAKEPLGQKGARITSHIALPGRFLVYMPTVDHIGVSRKIPSDEERAPPEAHPADQPHRHSGRLHRAHRGRGPLAKKSCAPT